VAEVTLLVMSTILTLGVIACGRAKRDGFDMLDAYFLMVMLYFGIYSAIDALVNEAADKDAAIVVLTFALIFFAMFVTWALFRILPSKFRIALRFDSLLEAWANVDHQMIAWLAVLFLAFHAYVFLEFGIFTYVGTEIERLDISVPNWIGPARALMNAIGFGVFLSLVASILKEKIRIRSLLGAVLLALVIVLALDGRRAFVELLILAFVLRCSSRRVNVYSAKYIPHVLVMLAAFIVLSNIYQTYRRELLSLQARLEGREVTSLISAAGNIEATIDNYRQRTAMWNYNYMITAEQVKDPTKIFAGELGWRALLSALPNVVLASKDVFDPDELAAELYGFGLSALPDYPTNDFATFLADYGILMVVVLPIAIVLILLTVAWSHFVFARSRTLFLLVSALCLQYLIKVENGYDIFILIRNILALVMLWLTIDVMKRVLRGAAAYAPRTELAGTKSTIVRP
jgi:hypothetical protein